MFLALSPMSLPIATIELNVWSIQNKVRSVILPQMKLEMGFDAFALGLFCKASCSESNQVSIGTHFKA